MQTIKFIWKSTHKTNVFIYCLLVIVIAGCSKDDGPALQEIIKSSDSQIISFQLLTKDNALLGNNIQVTINQNDNSLSASMPINTKVTALTPSIEVSPKANISPSGNQDFTNPVTYTITAEDGTKSDYTITLKVPSTQKDALLLILEDNPENELNWDLTITLDSELGSLEGVTTDGDGNITGLFLDFKNINELSPEITLLSSLELLKLDGNPITELPVEIGQLTTLKEISLKGTQLAAIPAEIGFLTNLETLLIKENPLTTLPPEIGLLSKLRRLDLENNQITSLPPEMGFLSNLIFLIIEESNLLEVPMSLAFLTTLNDFIGLSVLPPANIVSQKDALISIYSANPGNTLAWGVDNYPEVSFDDTGNPKVITMNNKNLTRLPSNIGQLTALEALNINGNNLTSLPTTLGNISPLVVIAADRNQLSTVPAELGDLNNFALLSITNNPITSIPQEVCDQQISNNGILTILTDNGEGCN